MSPSRAEPGPRHDPPSARWAFMVVAVALLPIMLVASSDYGVTWDERTRHRYGQLVWTYLTGHQSRSFFDEEREPYGGLFDVICVAVESWVPLNRYVVRHGINAIFGWVGIVYTGRLAAGLFGKWSGILAMILLAASPRYFADSMNNPKDLPFAAMTVVALFYISKILPTWPYMSRATAVKIVVALALALNIRPGALLYVGYFGLLIAAFAVRERSLNWRRLLSTSAAVAAMVVAVLLLGTVFWPWAQGAPLTRPIQALLGVANYDWNGRVLFDGERYPAASPRWPYAPTWFLISTPPVVIAGAILSILVTRGRLYTIRTLTLWGAALLPLFLVIVKGSTLYDGVRHLLFIYPIFVVLAASGWMGCLMQHNRPWLRRSAAVLLAAGLINILVFDVRAHPNQAVYFNELIGGPRGAFARFDMDYWGNCILQGVAWSANTARLAGRPIAISGNPEHLVQLDAERFPQLFFNRRKSQLLVRLARGSPEGVTELANQKDTLYRVATPDGAVLCVVLPGPDFAALQPYLPPLDQLSSLPANSQ